MSLRTREEKKTQRKRLIEENIKIIDFLLENQGGFAQLAALMINTLDKTNDISKGVDKALTYDNISAIASELTSDEGASNTLGALWVLTKAAYKTYVTQEMDATQLVTAGQKVAKAAKKDGSGKHKLFKKDKPGAANPDTLLTEFLTNDNFLNTVINHLETQDFRDVARPLAGTEKVCRYFSIDLDKDNDVVKQEQLVEFITAIFNGCKNTIMADEINSDQLRKIIKPILLGDSSTGIDNLMGLLENPARKQSLPKIVKIFGEQENSAFVNELFRKKFADSFMASLYIKPPKDRELTEIEKDHFAKAKNDSVAFFDGCRAEIVDLVATIAGNQGNELVNAFRAISKVPYKINNQLNEEYKVRYNQAYDKLIETLSTEEIKPSTGKLIAKMCEPPQHQKMGALLLANKSIKPMLNEIDINSENYRLLETFTADLFTLTEKLYQADADKLLKAFNTLFLTYQLKEEDVTHATLDIITLLQSKEALATLQQHLQTFANDKQAKLLLNQIFSKSSGLRSLVGYEDEILDIMKSGDRVLNGLMLAQAALKGETGNVALLAARFITQPEVRKVILRTIRNFFKERILLGLLGNRILSVGDGLQKSLSKSQNSQTINLQDDLENYEKSIKSDLLNFSLKHQTFRGLNMGRADAPIIFAQKKLNGYKFINVTLNNVSFENASIHNCQFSGLKIKNYVNFNHTNFDLTTKNYEHLFKAITAYNKSNPKNKISLANAHFKKSLPDRLKSKYADVFSSIEPTALAKPPDIRPEVQVVKQFSWNLQQGVKSQSPLPVRTSLESQACRPLAQKALGIKPKKAEDMIVTFYADDVNLPKHAELLIDHHGAECIRLNASKGTLQIELNASYARPYLHAEKGAKLIERFNQIDGQQVDIESGKVILNFTTRESAQDDIREAIDYAIENDELDEDTDLKSEGKLNDFLSHKSQHKSKSNLGPS